MGWPGYENRLVQWDGQAKEHGFVEWDGQAKEHGLVEWDGQTKGTEADTVGWP